MNAPARDPFGARAALPTPAGTVTIFRLDVLARQLSVSLEKLPFSIRILLEAVLRNCDGYRDARTTCERLAAGSPTATEAVELPFKPARVVLQDFTGVPGVVDLAAMRDAMQRLGGDPKRINPLMPVDLVIDHSVQVDASAAPTRCEQRRARVRAQPRALRVPPLGPEGVRQLPRGAARRRASCTR